MQAAARCHNFANLRATKETEGRDKEREREKEMQMTPAHPQSAGPYPLHSPSTQKQN